MAQLDLNALQPDVYNSIMIFLMQIGFVCLELGCVGEKKRNNVCLKSILTINVSFLASWVCGYAFAFGDGNRFIGYSSFFMDEQERNPLFIWHSMVAAIAATIVAGGVAERCDLRAYIIYTMVLTGFVYPVAAHWSWSSEGWLQTEGGSATDINGTALVTFQDYAGSGVVFLTGGVSAFVGAWMVGPREGRFDGLQMNRISEHSNSLWLTCCGAFLILIGFFAFITGSLGANGDGYGPVVARAVVYVNVAVAGIFGGVVALIIDSVVTCIKKRPRRFILSLLVTINGTLAAMVSICAGCNVMQPWAAALTGTVAAGVYYAVSCILSYMGIDDPMDAVAVHAGAGFWGLIATSIFNDKMVSSILLRNLFGGIAIASWSFINSLVMFWLLKKAGWLRNDSDDIGKFD